MSIQEPTDAADALRAQRDSALRELEQLSHAVSHDLRAPLRAIEGFASMLHDRAGDRLDADERRFLEVMRSSCTRMQGLIDDLVHHLRLASRPLQLVEVDMQSLADDAWRALPDHAGARLDLQPLPPARADRALMRHVWSALLGNALKFSASKAQPVVTVSAQREGGEVFYRVGDNGAGFDPAHEERLFQVFQRLHPAAAFAGNGIGLADVASIVARHGGHCGAQGAVGQGATFWFALPG